MAFTHLVSCNQEIESLIKEKNISPSQAFQLGVRKMAFEEITHLDSYSKIDREGETKLNQTIQSRDKLQFLLLKATDELTKLKEDQKNVQ